MFKILHIPTAAYVNWHIVSRDFPERNLIFQSRESAESFLTSSHISRGLTLYPFPPLHDSVPIHELMIVEIKDESI